MKNNLDPIMQARLDKWRAHPIPVKSLIDLRKKGMFLPRKEDPSHIYTEEELAKLKKLHNPTQGSK